MNIDDRMYVAIDYKLALASGEEVDSTQEGKPFGFIAGTGQIIPGLEKELLGKKAGYETKVTVEPEEGYGQIDDNLFQEVPRDQFPADTEVKAGMTFHAQAPHGPIMLRVKAVSENDMVTVDLNHPLAGEQLHFDVKVVEVREPSKEELDFLEKQQQQAAGCGCGCDAEDSADCGSGCSCG